ncbi:mediator of RNA polymerase II transcription subunit 15a-like [Oryza brachyantha]|uniref:mediator of RNA polymerase II transcription subunit 15a-like n=1 Tax=Oryza brachyantha TaxID=4533 RepID=UPI000776508F|nr:mediator of RNA polymerase II transcription subunit 15a-like [Oryza brachyantha]
MSHKRTAPDNWALHQRVVFGQQMLQGTTNMLDKLRRISLNIIDRGENLGAQGASPSQQQNVCTTTQDSSQVNQEQVGLMVVLNNNNILNINSTELSPVTTPGQFTQWPMQFPSQHQQQAKQLQPTNIAGCNPASLPMQLQGQNFQQNQVLEQNCSWAGTQQRQMAVTQQQQQQQEAQLMRLNQQCIDLMRMTNQQCIGENHQQQEQLMRMTNQQCIGENHQQQEQLMRMNQQCIELARMNQQYVVQNQQQSAELTMMNQQCMTGNQQQNCIQRNQILRTQQQGCAARIQIGHPELQKCQENVGMECHSLTPLHGQVVAAQQSVVCHSTQTSEQMISSGEEHWREEIFQKILSLKDSYLSELLEFDRMVKVPKISKERFSSLPASQAGKFKRAVQVKKAIRKMLGLLNTQKSDVHKGLEDEINKFINTMEQLRGCLVRKNVQNKATETGCQSQNCDQQPQISNLTGNASPFTCDERHQRQEEQLTDAKTPKIGQAVMTQTPTVHQENHGYNLLGVPSPCLSPLSVQPLSTNPPEDCFIPSPVTSTGAVQAQAAASPSASVKSPVSKPGAAWCASMKSRLASPTSRPEAAHVASIQVDSPLPAAVPSELLQSPVGEPQIGEAGAPLAEHDVTEFLVHSTEAAAEHSGCNQAAPPTEQLEETAPIEAGHNAQDQVGHGDERMEADKPISRLIQAILSSSPQLLLDTANSMEWVIREASLVPLALSGTDVSSISIGFHDFSRSEHTAKRQKTQMNANDDSFKKKKANDALLHEIETTNRKLVDTVISIADEDEAEETIPENGGGTLIELSYSAVSLTPSLKSHLATSEMPIVTPVKLFVPMDYPRSSPMLVDNDGEDGNTRELSDFSLVVGVAFQRALAELPEPRTIEATARAWDGCVRRFVIEVARRHGGGTFSSVHGEWVSCTMSP